MTAGLASWAVPGGTEFEYQSYYVAVLPYIQELASAMEQAVNRSCGDAINNSVGSAAGNSISGFGAWRRRLQQRPWKPWQRYELLVYGPAADDYGSLPPPEDDNNAIDAARTDHDPIGSDGDADAGSRATTTTGSDVDCVGALELSVNELQLMRVEERPSGRTQLRQLFLGDIHTDHRQRMNYRPTSYQPPLSRYDVEV